MIHKYILILYMLIISNTNAKNFDTLQQKLAQNGFEIKKITKLHDNPNTTNRAKKLAEQLQQKNKLVETKIIQDDIIYQIEITKPNIDTTMIFLLPITTNKPDVVNFAIDGLLVNTFILKHTTVNTNNGTIRFLPASTIKNMVNISVVTKLNNDIFIKDGIAVNTKDDIIKTEKYMHFLQIMEIITEEMFPDTKNVYLNGMSLGFTKMSLILSQSKLDILSIKFLLRLGIIINWSGAVSINHKYIGKILYPVFFLSKPIRTDI